MTGLGVVLGRAGIAATDLAQVFHGTTVATNLVFEGKGAAVGLITTAGFRHVLEIGRQDIPRRVNLFSWVKPRRPVEASCIFEVAGRIASGGSVVEPLDEGAVRIAARALADQGIAAVAIVLLHAYASSAHERRARELVVEVHPEAMVSLSSEVLPEVREYERSMATVLNVYTMPAVTGYVARLERRLAEAAVLAP